MGRIEIPPFFPKKKNTICNNFFIGNFLLDPLPKLEYSLPQEWFLMQPHLSGDKVSGLTHVRAVLSGGTVVRGNICPGNICPGGPTKRLGAADKWMMVTMLGWWPQGHHPSMVTIIHLSSGSTEPAVYTIRTRLGGVSPWSLQWGDQPYVRLG